jgi:hypothetical protein
MRASRQGDGNDPIKTDAGRRDSGSDARRGRGKIGERRQLQNDTVIAGEDAAPDAAAPGDDYGTGSAKMGEGEGTQSGDQGASHEDDTQKIDQPDRRNPTTSNDTYQGEEPAPSDYDHGIDK